MIYNILVYPAGSSASIEIHDSLTNCVNFKVYGAASEPRHAPYIFKNFTILPNISDPNFFNEINNFIKKNDIHLIFPTHDTVAEFFTVNQDKITTKIACSDVETARICRDKLLTYNYFSNYSFVPTYYSKNSNIVFPVFVKPRKGQGAKGSFIANSYNDIIHIDDSFIICEYLVGEECSVDCFTNEQGELQVISPRTRTRVFGGISVCSKSMTLTKEIQDIAIKINNKLKFKGVWYFQLKKDKNNAWKLLEISTRTPGTLCLTRARGFNLILMSAYIFLGLKVTKSSNILANLDVTVDRAFINRFIISVNWDTVFIDFDDTIYTKDKVNLKVIYFLYQCKNNHKKVCLLTKHKNDIKETLKKAFISEDIFDQIILLDSKDNKFKYIKPQDNAIFIDNAWKEREAVAINCKIPVFDVSEVECLLDWSE